MLHLEDFKDNFKPHFVAEICPLPSQLLKLSSIFLYFLGCEACFNGWVISPTSIFLLYGNSIFKFSIWKFFFLTQQILMILYWRSPILLQSKFKPPLGIITLKYLVCVDSSVVHLSSVVGKASRDIAVFRDLEINMSNNIFLHFLHILRRMELYVFASNYHFDKELYPNLCF